MEQRRWHGGLERRRWWILSLSLILILSFSHSDSLSRLDVGFGLLWIFVVGLLDWRGLEIKIGSRDWRSVVIAWWFGDRRQWHGGLERWRWWILSLSLTPILSLRLDVGFGFALNFLQVQSESFCFFFKKTKIFVLFCLFVCFFFCFDFVVRVSISNGICISSRAWIFLVGLPYLQSQ